MAGTFLSSQTHLDAVRPFTGLGGPGSRANGLGQAFTSIADDATALRYNPAGLAHLSKSEINLGFTHLTVSKDVTGAFAGTADITATRLNNAGFALPVPNTKLTLAMGYHQIMAFEREQELNGSYDDGTSWQDLLTEEGRMSAWSLGAGYQVSPKLALGGAFHILSGKNEYTQQYTVYEGVSPIYTDLFQIKPTYIGVGLDLGLMLSPLPTWRIGLLLRSPQGIKTEEEFTDNSSQDTFVYEYKTRSSYSGRLGSSLNIGPLLLSSDLFWFDYSQIRFESDIYDSTTRIDIGINDTLRTEYASAVGCAAGAEFLLPGINAKLRAGYRLDPPINHTAPSKMNQHTFALGFSIVPAPQIKLDAAFSHTFWKRDLTSSAEEKTAVGDVTINIVYRF
ncbi:MAG: outer membrane protein transport protein [Fidelibacterota bacterium]|nr:MAG: outer membrane protein transport protein [Candidatus Neomarinimicrobiota bacterium]